MSNDLRECPFCGGQAVLRHERICEDEEAAYVECVGECGVRGPAGEAAFWQQAAPYAIAAWNRRALPTVTAGDHVREIRWQPNGAE